MTFIISLVALLIERFFDWSHLRQWNWMVRYQEWLHGKVGNLHPYAVVAVDVLPLAIIVGLVNLILHSWLYGLFRLIFGVIILTYCLGPQNLWAEKNLSSREMMIESNQRIFAVLFWFALLGPMGAVLYRAVAVNTDLMAAKVKGYLDWIPARILTFIFALGGHFVSVFNPWRKNVFKGPEANEQLLEECGIAALHSENTEITEKDTLALLDRVFIIALVLLAIVTLFK